MLLVIFSQNIMAGVERMFPSNVPCRCVEQGGVFFYPTLGRSVTLN